MTQYTFTGSWKKRQLPVMMGLMALLGCGVVIAGFLQPHQNGGSFLISIGILTLTFGCAGAYAAVAFIESLAKFSLDDSGITKSTLRGSTTLLWNSIARMETYGLRGSNVTLTDSSGTVMKLCYGLIGDAGALNSMISHRTKALHQKRLEDTRGQTLSYHPTRIVGIVFLVGAFVFFIPVLIGVFAPQSVAGTPPQNLPFYLFFAAIALASLLGSIPCIVRTILFTPNEIIDKCLNGTYHIPYNLISSASNQTITGRNGSIEVFLIEGNGRKIVMSRSIPDYDLIRDYVLAHTSNSAQAQGTKQSARIQVQQAKTGAIGLSVMGVVLIILALTFMPDTRARLERYSRMDAHGVRATGRITDIDTGSKKSSITFSFESGGMNHIGRSYVKYYSLSDTRIGDKVEVIYVPEDPSICRAVQSIGPSDAAAGLYAAYGMIALGLFVIGVGWYSYRKQIRP